MSIKSELLTCFKCLPGGWYNKFAENLVDEIISTCTETELKLLQILDIKEKYGELRVYINLSDDKFDVILDKYTKMSRYVCMGCSERLDELELEIPICSNCKS